jgi:hypothetical protein
VGIGRCPSRPHAQTNAETLTLLDDGGYNHLEQPPYAVIATDRSVMELIVREWPPIVARVIHLIAYGQTGEVRVELPVISRHFVQHHIERRNDVDARTA